MYVVVKGLSFTPNVDSRVRNSSRYHFQGFVAMVISVALISCSMLDHFQCFNRSSAQVHSTTHPFRAVDLRRNFSQAVSMMVTGLTQNRINMIQTHVFSFFIISKLNFKLYYILLYYYTHYITFTHALEYCSLIKRSWQRSGSMMAQPWMKEQHKRRIRLTEANYLGVSLHTDTDPKSCVSTQRATFSSSWKE